MKRIFSSVLALAMAFACCYGVAFATEGSDIRASLTLSSYGIGMTASDSQGVICISYDVRATKVADSVGVESIRIYKSDGSHVATITGSTSNGLVRANRSIHVGDYNYEGTSGTSYYAKVTVFATIGSDYDSRVLTTSTVKAP